MYHYAVLLLAGLCAGAVASPPPIAPPARTLSVVSFQLPQDTGQWLAHREAVAGQLRDLHPDVITVHKVLQAGHARSQACWLADRLSYTCTFVTADPPSRPNRHGSALLTRHVLVEDGITLLHPPAEYGAAGMVRLDTAAGQLNVYTADLGGAGLSGEEVGHQADDLSTWIAATDDALPSVVAGEFALPTAQLVRHLSGFQPVGRNPRATARRTAADGQRHGLDVLYQVRGFADESRQATHLTMAGAQGDTAVLAVILITAPASP